jgi:AraC-like DNA-binding protein
MPYEPVIHCDATKQERLWLSTVYLDELLIPDQAHKSQYIDTSHLSGIFAQPLTVLFAGYGRWLAGQCMQRHEQPTVMGIEYVRSGNVVLTKNDREWLVEAGQVYFLWEDFPDNDRTGPAGHLCKRVVWLTGTILDTLLRSAKLWGKKHVQLARPRQCEALMRQLSTLLAHNPPDVDLQASALAYQLLLFLGQSCQPSLPSVLEEALAFIQHNLHRRLHIRDLCDHLGVNERYLGRLFSTHVGMSPIRYFLQQKLTWSANLLCSTSLSIKEVAYEAGYDDPFYFSSQFKKQFGISPKYYRQTNRLSS